VVCVEALPSYTTLVVLAGGADVSGSSSTAGCPETVREVEAAQADEPGPDEAAHREIAECDARLRQHRKALEADADPVLVTSWVSETQARRAVAEARPRRPGVRRRLTRDEITSLVTALGDVMRVLRDADPADKAEIYSRGGSALVLVTRGGLFWCGVPRRVQPAQSAFSSAMPSLSDER
jgi:hypothetical protein